MKNQLDSFRKQIDKLDDNLLKILAKRFQVVKKVGLLKKKQNIPVLDSVRWKKVIKLKKGYIKKIWEIIHDEALKIEKSLLILSEVEI